MKWGLEKPLYYVESGNQDRYFMDESEYQNYINSLESYST
jgi:DNA gyrase/topoisomerase IV subunit B